MRFATRAIHAGYEPEPRTGAIMPPVYFTSTYVQTAPGEHKGYEYARTRNPTRDVLEANLAALEEGRFAATFASGLAAEHALLSTLEAGDHVVCGRDVYGGTYRLFARVLHRFGLKATFVDTVDLGEVAAAFRPTTRFLWLETPSNPLLHVTDIPAAAALAHARGAKLVVDNTFATPYLQQPLKLGADFVIHSATKYLGGHSDVVGGAVVTNDPEAAAALKFLQNAVGAIPSPMDCFLVLRGTKTLAVRMERHCANALAVARFLREHPRVEAVRYPGLPDHPQHALARRQMRAFGGMVSFVLRGDLETARRFTRHTRYFQLAESLGGVESLVCLPALMTHASVPPEARRRGGLEDTLIRLSVGIEDVADLVADLEQALDAARA